MGTLPYLLPYKEKPRQGFVQYKKYIFAYTLLCCSDQIPLQFLWFLYSLFFYKLGDFYIWRFIIIKKLLFVQADGVSHS